MLLVNFSVIIKIKRECYGQNSKINNKCVWEIYIDIYSQKNYFFFLIHFSLKQFPISVKYGESKGKLKGVIWKYLSIFEKLIKVFLKFNKKVFTPDFKSKIIET